jgi:hypothetical protein
MLGRPISLSPQRQFICDLTAVAQAVPTIPMQRRMSLGTVVAARTASSLRLSWTAIFTKAYAKVATAVPELRRAYVKFPKPHLYEYPASVASIAFERVYRGENGVFIGRIKDPAGLSLEELHRAIRSFQEVDIEQCKDFQRLLRISRLPGTLRRLLWWVSLNIGRQRGNYFGTFGVTACSALGAELLHPLSPLTTTLTYGVIEPDGRVDVRLLFDHRVMDGATVARALKLLEGELTGAVCEEMQRLSPVSSRFPERMPLKAVA